jgi:hypothetical protein
MTERVVIDQLTTTITPRLPGVDIGHAQTLATSSLAAQRTSKPGGRVQWRMSGLRDHRLPKWIGCSPDTRPRLEPAQAKYDRK